MNLQVQNIGNSEGFFDFSTSCGNGVTTSANSQDIAAGQTQNVNVLFSGSTSTTSANTGSCSITVKDRSSGVSDTCNFQYTVNYKSFIAQCSPEGLTQCSPDKTQLLTCTNGQYLQKLCSNGCVIENNIAVCATMQQNNSNSNSQQTCQQKADANPFLGYTYVASSSSSCSFPLCTIGLTSPSITTTEECKAQYVPYYIFAIALVVVLIFGIILLRSPRRRR